MRDKTRTPSRKTFLRTSALATGGALLGARGASQAAARAINPATQSGATLDFVWRNSVGERGFFSNFLSKWQSQTGDKEGVS